MHLESPVVRAASGCIVFGFLLAILYLGRFVLEPLSIAVLLGLILAPPIRWLRRVGTGRVTSVIIIVLLALMFIGGLGLIMETQVSGLANELPKYQKNLQDKINSLNQALVPTGALKRASTALKGLADELQEQSGGTLTGGALKGRDTPPIPVEVRAPQLQTLEQLQNLINPLLTPLTMGALIILFLVFILFYREDLRDRVLRLAGAKDLQRTTEAMNEAGQRLSKFFVIQSAINGAFGLFIGTTLWIIGIPNAALWGMLAAVLRFVPYVGTPIAAVFPLVLASAIDPGWSKFLATAILFFGGEVLTGQAIEPVLQGQHTGLSPVAIVISTLFWTLIWGVPGLVLAVPITVCISVLGKHIDSLYFLGVLLGDRPALAPHEGFYQRLLAADATEATFQAEERLSKDRLADYYDAVPMKALALAEADAAGGKLPRDQQLELYETIEEIVDELADYKDEPKRAEESEQASSDPGKIDPVLHEGQNGDGVAPSSSEILLVSAQSPLDQSASLLLAHLLRSRGLTPLVQPYLPTIRSRDFKPATLSAEIVCISYFGAAHNPVLVRYAIRRLRRLFPEATFLSCFWLMDANREKLEEWRNKVGAEAMATSLKEAADFCCVKTQRHSEPLSERAGKEREATHFQGFGRIRSAVRG